MLFSRERMIVQVPGTFTVLIVQYLTAGMNSVSYIYSKLFTVTEATAGLNPNLFTVTEATAAERLR